MAGAGLIALAAGFFAGPAAAEGFKPVGGLYYSSMYAGHVSLPDGSVIVVSDNAVQKLPPGGGSFFLVAYLPTNHGTAPTATLLLDGRVLVAGGESWTGAVRDACLYDPVANTVSPTGALSTARTRHTATLLADGRVLVAGGGSSGWPGSALASAEVYDPLAGTFSPADPMTSARLGATATRLPDGRVLVAGGYAGADAAPGGTALASAELFDPAADSFVPAADMGAPRADHAATALADGSVLITGGHAGAPGPSVSSTEIYDPSTGVFTPSGEMESERGAHTATLLEDGRVLVAGGFTAFPYAPTLASAEIWDPTTGLFTPVAHGMRDARGRHVAAALPGGEVLVAGGLSQYGGVLYSAEVYSPSFVDSEPPVIHPPGDFTVSANAYDPTGQYVYYYPWASDNVDPSPVVTCEPASGSFLLVGTHPVSCSATDSWGNSASAGFTVTVLPPLEMTFAIDAFGSVDTKTGAAVVSGTVSCSRPASGWVGGELRQVVAARATLAATFSVYLQACGTPAAPWVATAASFNGPFKPGKATVGATASANDAFSFASASAQLTIQLRAKK